MKKFLLLSLLAGISVALYSQQALSLRPKITGTSASFRPSATTVDFNELSNWGLVGIGNLNLETFKDVNISGKISGYKRLNRSTNNFTTFHFSLNKNASNNDSLLATTFLFPDIGNASAAFTLDHFAKIGIVKNNNINMIGGFFDFFYKNIKADKDKVEREFTALGYTMGLKYLNWYHDPNNEFDFVASFALYFSVANVPDEDNEDYRMLFGAPNLQSAISSFGCKIGIQINNLQFFADLKACNGSADKIPVRALRGFNGNVGVVFNAEVFEK